MDFEKSLKAVKETVNGKKWNGTLYTGKEEKFIYLDNKKIIIPDDLCDAYQIVGQTVKEKKPLSMSGTDAESSQAGTDSKQKRVVSGIYIKNIFFGENGLQIFLLEPQTDEYKEYMDDKGLIKCMGYFTSTQKYMPLKLEGEFKDSEYGSEFNFENIEIQVISMENTELYLIENSKSLQKRQIRQILDITGDDIFTACRKPGIEEEICQKINADELDVFTLFDQVKTSLTEFELFKLMLNYGGTYDQTMKIMNAFPGKSVEELIDYPYAILDKVSMSFNVIDQIALNNGVDPMSQMRIQAVAYEIVREQENAGNVFLTLDDLSKLANKICREMPKMAIASALLNHPSVIRDDDSGFYYDKSMLKDEKNAARNFARLMRTRKMLPWHPEYIGKIEEEQGYTFGSQQREAFLLLQTTGFKLLTGDPGTGKTSTLKGLLRYLEMLWQEEYGKDPVISLCAPSGRAAQRMKEATKRVAQTIHKLIEYRPFGNSEYYRDASNPLEADIVVVDESSMMGLSIFNKLISAIKNGALVLIIGDTNQLQSVDPGDVLADIIKCGYVDSCHLTETFRQAENSCININAKRIMQGNTELVTGDDFEIIESSPEETLDILKQRITELMSETTADSIQVLSPTHRGSCGVRNGNTELQALINPGKDGQRSGSRIFRAGDRIIMTNNNYSLSYYNGDIGYIQNIGDGSMSVLINGENIVIPKSNYSDMDLAYFTTVHKAQGSEYDYVVIVLQAEASNMMSRQILYTAVTRARKKVSIIEENGLLDKAIKTYFKETRRSLLSERIQNELNGPQV